MVDYFIVIVIVKFLAGLPFRILYTLSDLLYYPVYYLVRYRRKIVRKNLTESFPDKSLDEIVAIEKKFYHYLIDLILESCKLISISPEEMKSRVKFVNIELVNEMLRNGKSVSCYIGHYCNWEWMSSVGLWITKESTCAQIYHKLNDKSIELLMRRLRERMGCVCVDMHKTARFVANTTEENKSYVFGFIADQSPKWREVKHYVNFMSHYVPVLVGPEKITKHYSFEAVFLSVRRVKRGYYECVLSVLHDDPKSLPDYQLSDLYIQKLESEIRRQPEFYLWSHNRFRLARENNN